MLLKKYMMLFVVLVCLSIFMGCSSKNNIKLAPEAVNGVLDLNNWDFQNNGMAELNGQWEFYNRQLLEPKAFKTKKSFAYFDVNKSNNYLKYNGYGTYRLKLKMKQPKDLLYLNFKSSYFEDYKIWVDDELVASKGEPSVVQKVKKPFVMTFDMKQNFVRLNTNSNEFYITLQISSAIRKNLDGIKITNSIMDNTIQYQVIIEYLCYGIMLCGALYYFVMYIFMRKEKVHLVFALLCLNFIFCIMVYKCLYGEEYLILSDLIPNFSRSIFGQYGTIIMFDNSFMVTYIFLVSYLYLMFSNILSKKVYDIIIRLFVVLLIFSNIFLNLDRTFNVYFTNFSCYLYHFIGVGYVIYVICMGKIKKASEIKFVSCGIYIFIAGIGFEVVAPILEIGTQNLVTLSFVALVLFNAFALAHKFSQSLYNTEKFSSQIESTLEKLKVLIEKSTDVYSITDDSVKQLAAMTNQIGVSNKEVLASVFNMSEGAAVQMEKSNYGLKVADMLDQSSEDIKSNANIMKQATIQIMNMSEKGTEFATSLFSMQEKSAIYMKNVYDVVNELVERINNISNFSNVIVSIAKETELLAFNATIEAAKSGENGRGFNVIAQNIKKLANQSDVTAKQIQLVISGIVGIANDTVNKLNLVHEVSLEQNMFVDGTVEIFKNFKDTVSISISKINNVYDKINELIKIRDMVISSINEISKVSENNSVIIEQVTQIIEEQSQQMSNIDYYTQKLKDESENMRKHINGLNIN